MKNKIILSILFLSVSLATSVAQNKEKNTYPFTSVPFTSVKITDSFWGERIKANREVTIPLAFGKCESTGRVDNFKIAGGLMEGDHFLTDYTFDDTDIYKTIEGASYSLQTYWDQNLKNYIDTLLVFIKAAQEEDGYLYPARTINPEHPHPWAGQKRWEKEEYLSHELYNLGHLIEASVAHFRATKDSTMLKIAMKFADLAVKDFGWGKIEKAPGHQIAEMALAELYNQTGKKEYLDLAKFFLDVKGRSDITKTVDVKSLEYSQAHKLVTEQDEAVGHAVRATYMYSGMADIAALTKDEKYAKAIDKIWNNVVSKKLYITGGIGATNQGEAFGENYYLPNMSAYCETCAAIANVFWNKRLFLLHGESKYYDVLERTLYNGLISGVSLDGGTFFYPNPLESMGQHSRREWFGCSCCPSNITRFIPSVPGYIYSKKDRTLFVNLFISNDATIELDGSELSLSQTSEMPYEGKTDISIKAAPKFKFDLMIRIPGWVKGDVVPSDLYQYENNKVKPVIIKLNGKRVEFETENGYAKISRKWKTEDKIELEFPMDVKIVKANAKVEADRGRIAIERGPLVYCAEWVDNSKGVLNLLYDPNANYNAKYKNDLLGGIETITTQAKAYSYDKKGNLTNEKAEVTLIPYFAWANRGAGEMMVWMPVSKSELKPVMPPSIASESKVTGSYESKALRSVNDQLLPKNSKDTSIPYYHWWGHEGNPEWISYEFKKEYTISESSVYWYDDSPWGGCHIPEKWNLLYLDDSGLWQPVEPITEYQNEKDKNNTVKFKPVSTTGMKIVVQESEKYASGLYEWSVK